MTCGLPICRCEARERLRAEPVQVYDCPTCGNGGFAVGPATLAALELVKHADAHLALEGGTLCCATCLVPMRNRNERPCGACAQCWTTAPSAGVRVLDAAGQRGLPCCLKCQPLRWHERLPELDGAGPLGYGIDPGPRLLALFDELETLRARQTRGAA